MNGYVQTLVRVTAEPILLTRLAELIAPDGLWMIL